MAKLQHRAGQQGFALIIVLWFTAVLAVLAYDYARNVRLERAMVSNIAHASTQTLDIASLRNLAAYNYALYAKNKKLLNDETTIPARKDNPVTAWRPSYTPYKVTLGEVDYYVRILSADGLFNVNKIAPATLQKVFEACGASEEKAKMMINVLKDWTDKDDLHHIDGAEKEYYQKAFGGGAKNNSLESIQELRLLKGFEDEYFTSTAAKPGLYDFLSTTGTDGKLNINFAVPGAFYLVEGMSQSSVSSLLSAREDKLLTSMGDLFDVVQVEQASELKKYFSASEPTGDVMAQILIKKRDDSFILLTEFNISE